MRTGIILSMSVSNSKPIEVNKESPIAFPLHGLKVHDVTVAETMDQIDGYVKSGSPHHIITLDASMCVTAKEDKELFKIVSNAALVTPDSAGVLWACKKLGHPLRERVSGVDLVEQLCELSPSKGYKLYFFGSAPGVTDDAAERFRQRFPGCHIVGTRNGFFKPEESEEIAGQIKETGADILFVAMGIPKQEKWIAHFGAQTGAKVLIGVGGSFDVHSGRVERAPVWIQKINMEWLHRLIKNPKKYAKVLTLPRFVAMTYQKKKS